MNETEQLNIDVNAIVANYKAVTDDLMYQLVMERAKSDTLSKMVADLQQTNGKSDE